MDFDWEFNAPHWCDFSKEINDNNADFWFETPGSVSPMTKKKGIRTPIRQRNPIMNTPITQKLRVAPSPKIKEKENIKLPHKVTLFNDKTIQATPVQNKNSMHSCLKRAKINKTEELTPLMKFRTILPW